MDTTSSSDIGPSRRGASDLGTVLGVWAHPDDEAYCSGGLMATARAAGERVVVVTATRGELGASHPSETGEQVARRREREVHTSLAALGVREHHWLGYVDGSLAAVPAVSGARRIAAIVDAVRPDTIVTFGPDGLTGHADHRAISRWTTAAWELTGRSARLLYATLTPEFHDRWGALCDSVGVWMDDERVETPSDAVALTVECRGEILDRKMAALRAHASQTRALVDLVGEGAYREWWSTEWFVDAADVTVSRLLRASA